MAPRELQVGQRSQRWDAPQALSDDLRGWIEQIATEAGDAGPSLPITVQAGHVEQMYQLAEIFASIFDALRHTSGEAIATKREAT
jgi:hypothetical protein